MEEKLSGRSVGLREAAEEPEPLLQALLAADPVVLRPVALVQQKILAAAADPLLERVPTSTVQEEEGQRALTARELMALIRPPMQHNPPKMGEAATPVLAAMQARLRSQTVALGAPVLNGMLSMAAVGAAAPGLRPSMSQ